MKMLSRPFVSFRIPPRGRLFAGAMAAAMAIALLAAACSGSSKAAGATGTPGGSPASPATPTQPATQPAVFYGMMPEPAVSMPSVTLTDTSGKPFNLEKQTKGDVTLLYTGYTHCPDVCPATMAELAGVVKQLPPDVASHVKVIFISTDPNRDTQQVIRAWLDKFDPNFIGLRANIQTVDQVEKDLNLPLSYDQPTGTGSYGVVHSAVVFAFGKSGVAHLEYPQGFSIADYVHDVTALYTKGFQMPKTGG